MRTPRACPLPPRTLLARYAQAEGFADCYTSEVDGAVSLARFVEAFYTGAVIRLERRLLGWFASRPSTDGEARELAHAERTDFAAWHVEDRTANELLLGDWTGRTRSWLMVMPPEAGGRRTRVYFGSAVVPVTTRTGRVGRGLLFHALLGFHRVYSRVLLGSAVSGLHRLREA